MLALADLDGGVDGSDELHEIKQKSGDHISDVPVSDLSIAEEDPNCPPKTI